MEAAALALRNLSQNKENKAVRCLILTEGRHACPGGLRQGSLKQWFPSRRRGPQEMMSLGAVGPLVEMLAHGGRRLKEGAAACLAALGTHDVYQTDIAEAGAIPLLVGLMLKGGPAGREAAALALCNLSWHIDVQGEIVRAGGVPAFAAVLVNADRQTTPGAAAAAAGAVDNLTAVSDENKAKFAAAGVIGPLVLMSQSPDPEQAARQGRFGEIPHGKALAAQALRNLSAIPELKVEVEEMTEDVQERKERALRPEEVPPLLNGWRTAGLLVACVLLILRDLPAALAVLLGVAWSLAKVAVRRWPQRLGGVAWVFGERDLRVREGEEAGDAAGGDLAGAFAYLAEGPFGPLQHAGGAGGAAPTPGGVGAAGGGVQDGGGAGAATTIVSGDPSPPEAAAGGAAKGSSSLLRSLLGRFLGGRGGAATARGGRRKKKAA